MFKILQDVNSCSEDLRWSSQFCASHAKIESCLKRAFEKCFNKGSAQKLVRGEKVRLRSKIQEEWANRIQVLRVSYEDVNMILELKLGFK